jgi:hypothetical protein
MFTSSSRRVFLFRLGYVEQGRAMYLTRDFKQDANNLIKLDPIGVIILFAVAFPSLPHDRIRLDIP